VEYKIKDSFIDILENEINLNLMQEKYKIYLNNKSDWNIKTAFDSIDKVKMGFINSYDI